MKINVFITGANYLHNFALETLNQSIIKADLPATDFLKLVDWIAYHNFKKQRVNASQISVLSSIQRSFEVNVGLVRNTFMPKLKNRNIY